MAKQSKYDELREKIRGPVYPVPPAFNKDFSIDLDGVTKYVEFLNSHDVGTLMVTAGTSRFNLLTEEEIDALNRTVVEANGGKAVTVVANPVIGSTDKAIEYAKKTDDMGADALLLYYPERYYNDDCVFDYFEAAASNTDAGVLIHGIPMRNSYSAVSPNVQYSVELCRRLASIENLIGMKEESGSDTHRYKLAANLSDEMSFIVAGASMRMFMGCMHFGVDTYLVGVGSFAPKIEEDFYKATLAKDYDKAFEMVKKYEEPFFDVAFPMGWHLAMKGAMELLGLMDATDRPPLRKADKEDMDKLKNVLKKIELL